MRFPVTATCDFRSHQAVSFFRLDTLASKWVNESRMMKQPTVAGTEGVPSPGAGHMRIVPTRGGKEVSLSSQNTTTRRLSVHTVTTGAPGRTQ